MNNVQLGALSIELLSSCNTNMQTSVARNSAHKTHKLTKFYQLNTNRSTITKTVIRKNLRKFAPTLPVSFLTYLERAKLPFVTPRRGRIFFIFS